MVDTDCNPLKGLDLPSISRGSKKIRNDISPRPSNSTNVIQDKTPRPKKISFSFKCWQQNETFGLASVKTSWFISVLNRLADLCDRSPDDLFTTAHIRDFYRFHRIDWNQKNCPYTEEKFWELLPASFIKNPEASVYQFQVSQAKGRIIGFFDVKTVFQIVLMDPEHNMQPSKDYNYVVDPTVPLECEFLKVKNKLLGVMSRLKGNGNADEKIKKIEELILDDQYDSTFRHIDIPSELFEDISALMSDNPSFMSLDDIMLEALIALQEKQSAK